MTLSAIQAFDEVRFPEKIEFGFFGGPEFFTTIVTTKGGQEQRNINWEEVKHRFGATHRLKDQSELDELRAFFFARRGRATGFRFRDWADFASDMVAQNTNAPYSTLDGIFPDGQGTHQRLRNTTSNAIGVADGVTTQFQLVKEYLAEPRKGEFLGTADLSFNDNDPSADTIVRASGSWITDGFEDGDRINVNGAGSNDGYFDVDTVTALTLTLSTATSTLTTAAAVGGVSVFSNEVGSVDYVRDVKKPVKLDDGTAQVRVYVNDTLYSEATAGPNTYTIDTTTGIVTFNTAPADGDEVEWDGLFDTPVRFNTDRFSSQLEHFNRHDFTNIELIEVRI
jgi:hypothetical protein